MTLSTIARERRHHQEGPPLVTGALQPVVQGILKTTCMNKAARLHRFKSDFKVRRNPDRSSRYQGMYKQWSGLSMNARGQHQVGNAALALAALEILEKKGYVHVDQSVLEHALKEIKWPARLEVLDLNPMIVLDGAHNPRAPKRFARHCGILLRTKSSTSSSVLWLTKTYGESFRRLLPMAETAIFTKPRYQRAANPDEIRKMARPYIQKHYVIPDPASAIQEARRLAGPDDLICITGSLYFAGEVKEIFGEPTGLP